MNIARDDRVDAYITRSADYARPVLKKLREWVHDAAPEIEEDIKWDMPAFMHLGIVANMAAFKKHVSFGFWKGQLMKDHSQLFENAKRTQITALKLKTVNDLPDKEIFAAYVREANGGNEHEVHFRPARDRDVP